MSARGKLAAAAAALVLGGAGAATLADGATGSAPAAAQEARRVVVTLSDSTPATGDTVRIAATAYNARGARQANARLNFRSTAPTVLDVDGVAREPGETWIVATWNLSDGAVVADSVRAVVSPELPTSGFVVAITPHTGGEPIVVLVRDTLTIVGTVWLPGASTEWATDTLTVVYSPSDTAPAAPAPPPDSSPGAPPRGGP